MDEASRQANLFTRHPLVVNIDNSALALSDDHGEEN